MESKGLMQISDPAQIEAIVDKVLAASPQQLELFRGGKTKLQDCGMPIPLSGLCSTPEEA